ncbi:MAG TPA: sulfotransferase family protein [Ignavibacteria bacterium]|nr:sulfotransferase family protein [Ignavibacteria bacterium]
MKRICLWSSPRNISTALMYSFAQRNDTKVIDEPLYAHYLSKTNADHPGKEEILADMENDGEKVIEKVILGDHEEDIIFMKQMTHHLIRIDESFLDKVTNVFLIRDPKQLISSLAQVIPVVNMHATGIKRQHELFHKLSGENNKPVVIDSGEILKSPEAALIQLCNALNIPFIKSMLHWQPGPIKEDGIWAKYWYENVHKSSGFEKQHTSSRDLPAELADLYKESLSFYKDLFDHSIKV